MASVTMTANSVCKSFFILFVLELLGDFDQEVGDVANIGEAAVDLYIDIFWLVMGVVEVHGGTDVTEIPTVLEAILQHHTDRAGAAGDACAAETRITCCPTVEHIAQNRRLAVLFHFIEFVKVRFLHTEIFIYQKAVFAKCLMHFGLECLIIPFPLLPVPDHGYQHNR